MASGIISGIAYSFDFNTTITGPMILCYAPSCYLQIFFFNFLDLIPFLGRIFKTHLWILACVLLYSKRHTHVLIIHPWFGWVNKFFSEIIICISKYLPSVFEWKKMAKARVLFETSTYILVSMCTLYQGNSVWFKEWLLGCSKNDLYFLIAAFNCFRRYLACWILKCFVKLLREIFDFPCICTNYKCFIFSQKKTVSVMLFFILVSVKRSSTKKWGKPLDLTGVSLLWQELHLSPKMWYITSLAWTWKFLNCTVWICIFFPLICTFNIIYLSTYFICFY